MVKNMKKIFSLLLIVACVFLLIACKEPEVVITQEVLENLVFEDGIFDYDGEEHSIYVENKYEEKGVKISYRNNKQVNPGTYTVTATIKYEDLKVSKKANLTINKAQSVLEAEAVQTFYNTDKELSIQYKLNNDKQEIVFIDKDGNKVSFSDLTKEGTYEVEAYAPENEIYLESNHVKITFNIVESKYGIRFDSKEVVANGQEQKIELEGTLPSGYTVEYANNTGVEDGSYYATATIKDASGNAVETHYAVLKIENPENEEFKKYLDEFFVEYLEGDQLSVNIFCENPEKFGLERYDAEWYTFTSFTDEDLASDLESFKELLAELEEFKDAPLNDLQDSAYATIENFLKYYVEYYQMKDVLFNEILYVDQFGGYVADFGTYMEAYSLRCEEDIQDVINYINSTKEAFPSYLEFVELKKQKGYPLSDFTIKEMRGYLKDVITEGDKYYLIDILSAHIDAVEFLETTKKEEYKAAVAEGIKNSFIPGVQELYDGLEQYLGVLAEEDEGYWATYEQGQELFVLELERLLGMDNIDTKFYINELDKAIRSTVADVISTQTALINEYKITTWEQLESVINSKPIFEGTPDEMVVFLREFAKEIVPELKSTPEITVKEMDEASAKVSNAVAYYMKSALDNTKGEYITLNPVKLKDSTSTDVLGTLAHEGYPGHLYAYVYSKELGLSNLATVMTSTAHGEGWATYVELALYEYAMANSTDKGFIKVMEYLYANQLSGFLLETRIDAGIHLEGWTVEDVATFMDELGYSSDGAGEIYDLIIEMPTQYAAYGYGKLFFNKLHREAKSLLGIHYDEIEFNAMLLSRGWTGLDILQETYDAYMATKCHELGIEYK